MSDFTVTVSIDTEEDDWGSFAECGATSENIAHLPEVHERMAQWGARPTLLVNRPPLLSSAGVAVLAELGARPDVEIGGHCHPWNTPPSTGPGIERSMMSALPLEANRGKIADVTARIRSELGVTPRSFRAGRWGFGPTVSQALAAEGYTIDASVSPFIDWTPDGGPDYTAVPHRPYRFDPARPYEPDPDGVMVEIPTTIGYLDGKHRQRAALRRRLERSALRRLSIVGILETTGLMRRRWLSPETSSADDMVRLAAACLRSGEPILGLTFHSCTLLPGATPFVRDPDDRKRFLAAIDTVLSFLQESGARFQTLSEVGAPLLEDRTDQVARAP